MKAKYNRIHENERVETATHGWENRFCVAHKSLTPVASCSFWRWTTTSSNAALVLSRVERSGDTSLS